MLGARGRKPGSFDSADSAQDDTKDYTQKKKLLVFAQIRRTLTASSLCDEAASPVKITGEVRFRRSMTSVEDPGFFASL